MNSMALGSNMDFEYFLPWKVAGDEEMAVLKQQAFHGWTSDNW